MFCDLAATVSVNSKNFLWVELYSWSPETVCVSITFVSHGTKTAQLQNTENAWKEILLQNDGFSVQIGEVVVE